jgi:hypothetical protein
MSAALVGVGAAMAFRASLKLLDELGEISDQMSLGYDSANAIPLAGQPHFPDTSGVRRSLNVAQGRYGTLFLSRV